MTRRVNVPRAGYDDLAATVPGEIIFSVGAEGGDTIVVTAQLYDLAGNRPTEKQFITAWLSDTAKAGVTATAPSGTTGPTTGTLIKAWTAKTHEDILTDATGLIVFSAVEAGALTRYLNIAWAGVVRSSAVITWVP
jgi:hypothetical protein